MPQVAGERQVGDDDHGWKDDADQSLGEHVERSGRGQPPAGGKRRASLPKRQQKTVQSKGEPKRDEDIGNKDAGVEIRAKGEPQSKRGVESGGGVKVKMADGEGGQQQGEHGERQRQARGPIGCAEQFIAGGHAPVEQRRFFQVSQAVDVEGGPVVAEHHLARGLGVHGIGIVEQRRAPDAGNVEGKPDQHDQHHAKRGSKRARMVRTRLLVRAWRDRVDYTDARLKFGEVERAAGAEIAFAAEPVGEAVAEQIEGHARADFEEAVGDGKSVVKDGIVGEVAHGEVVEPVEGAGVMVPALSYSTRILRANMRTV